ncbi:EAL domain-containing protein [Agrobacterium rubi]|nr:EAL domain-containing protein [Agrobacterium rubi]NTF24735.1 EAL domain-containing protein [Agrobacterium rubi]
MIFKYADTMFPSDDEFSVKGRVRFSLVKSLFLHRSSLWFGFMAQIVASVIALSETRDMEFVWSGVVHSIIVLARFLDFKRYDSQGWEHRWTASPDEVNRLETRYIVGSALQSLSFGFQAGYANYWHLGSVTSLIMLGIVLASLTAVPGRNFGSPRNVNIILPCATFPILIAWMLNSNLYLKMAAILVIATMISCRQFAANVRTFNHDQILSSIQAREVALRFDSALQHMPNGLMMTDKNGRIIVINPKAMEILGIPQDFDFTSRGLIGLARLGLRRKQWVPVQKKQFEAQIEMLMAGEVEKELVGFTNGVTLEVSVSNRFDDLGNRDGLVMILDDVSTRMLAQEKVEFLAHHDNMTSLPNRHHFSNLLASALASMDVDQKLAFCVFDIDRFKVINDTLGHSVGDKVIINIARRMQQIDDPRMICARIGGDEFVLVFHSLGADDNITDIFDAAFGNICSPSMIEGKVMNVRCSAGVSTYGRDSFELDEAFVRADIALYDSKKNPEVIWTYFDKKMDDAFRAAQETKQDLRKAVLDGSFKAVYQPMYTPDGRRIECCEALARWEHPTLGTIAPSVFIEMAEGMRVVGDITRQMLFAACSDCMTWPKHISVSVNLSALDLLHDDILGLVSKTLEATGLAAHRLQVEVTESALATNRDGMAQRLRALRELGVKTALDDFGTGYSSLSYLSDLPFDKVKIDRSFVTRIVSEDRPRTLFNAVVNLSRELGFEIVVEGVEGSDQLEMVKNSQGVDLIQGFIFGPPMQSEQIAASAKLCLLPVPAMVGNGIKAQSARAGA